MDNASLIEQCSHGSREAMESLYCCYSRRMMRVIHRYVRDRKCAEDILHDGFVLIFTHISEVRQPERLEFWMGTIMKNLCLNYLGSLDVMTLLDEDIELPEIPDLDDILSYEEIEQLINRLPTGYRTVFKLAVLEGKSHKEIGRILGISPNSSSSQLFHAKVLLRKLINERKRELGLIVVALMVALGLAIPLFRSNTTLDDDMPEAFALVPPDNTEKEQEYEDEHIASVTVPAPVATGRLEEMREPTEMPADTAATADSPDVMGDAPADTVQTESVSEPVDTPEPMRRALSGARTTYADIPRKAIASAGWSVGAHYTVGTQTPSFTMDYVALDSPAYSDFVSGEGEAADSEPLFPPSFYSDTDYDLPITFGVSVSKRLASRLRFETGLSYTYMRATMHYTSLKADRTVKSNFIGIPLKLSYTFFERSRFSLYGTAGASVDFPVGKSEKISLAKPYTREIEFPELKSKTEISVHGGVGIQYSLAPSVGLYVEPGVRHYFSNGATSPSYWQEHRTVISVPVGIKINF